MARQKKKKTEPNVQLSMNFCDGNVKNVVQEWKILRQSRNISEHESSPRPVVGVLKSPGEKPNYQALWRVAQTAHRKENKLSIETSFAARSW
jgi:hypothetical protein